LNSIGWISDAFRFLRLSITAVAAAASDPLKKIKNSKMLDSLRKKNKITALNSIEIPVIFQIQREV
jgi:hypothetical protein